MRTITSNNNNDDNDDDDENRKTDHNTQISDSLTKTKQPIRVVTREKAASIYSKLINN